MKTLYRILGSCFAIFCLILFVATAILWFRSRTNLDEFYILRPHSVQYVWSGGMRIYIFRYSSEVMSWGETRMVTQSQDLSRLNYENPIQHQFGPFGYEHVDPNTGYIGGNGHRIMFPHWLLLVLFALLPAFVTRRFFQRRSKRFRAAHGLCLRCGYDVRASPERCPECGLEKSAAAAGS